MGKTPQQMSAAPAQAAQAAPDPSRRSTEGAKTEAAAPTPISKDAAAKAAREKEKRAAFTKLGNKRLVKARDAIRLLKNLANKNNYSFTDDDRKSIIATLDNARNLVNDAFNNALAGKAVQDDEEGSTFFS